jgi:hypothetical protein
MNSTGSIGVMKLLLRNFVSRRICGMKTNRYGPSVALARGRTALLLKVRSRDGMMSVMMSASDR